jgi:thiamine-monophosphate kinase
VSLEGDLIHWLEMNLPRSSRSQLGLSDDAAVLTGWGKAQPVITTDLLTDGVDFLLDEAEPRQIGHKALGVNLSDLAAMAARPVAAFVALVLPTKGSERLSAFDLATGIYQGMLPLAQRLGVTIAGGDTNSWDGPLAISITAVGETTADGPLTRSGGQIGDSLLVTGKLGGSILGRHLEVEPRVEEALFLNQRFELHAGVDISDGLALDTARLAKASGLGAVLDLSALPLDDAAHRLSKQDGRSALEHALGDGEDFELVLAVPDQAARQLLHEQPLAVGLTRFGQLIEPPGLWQENEQGALSPLESSGFQHGENL